MHTKMLTPACAGIAALALSACGPKGNGGSGTAPDSPLNAAQKSSHFDAVSAHLDLGGVAYGYLDIDGDAEKLADALQQLVGLANKAGPGEIPPQIAHLDISGLMDDLGLTGIEALGMSSYKNGDLYRNTFYMHVPGGRTGLLEMLGGEAGAFATQKLAPAGSDLVAEQELDLKSAFALVKKLVAKVGGPEAAAAFAEATSEPMPGGPPLSVADIFANLDTRLILVARVNPDKPMPLPEDVPFKVPGIDAMIALDNLGALATKIIASIPEDQRAQMLQEGDGFQQIAIPVPPEISPIMQPVIRHDIASGRVMFATSPAFLDECLSAKTSVWDDAGFKAAMEGLPNTGNGLSFVSARFMKEYLRVYGDAMDSIGAQASGTQGLGESVVGLLTTLGMSPDHAQAQVTTNLPEGVLVVQNSAASAKQVIVATAAVVPAAMVFAGFASVRSVGSAEVIELPGLIPHEAVTESGSAIVPNAVPTPLAPSVPELELRPSIPQLEPSLEDE